MPITADPEIPKSTNVLPGVDHSQHIETTRQEIADAAGVKVTDVTPQGEVAENVAASNIQNFLEGVVHTPTDKTNPATDKKQTFLEGLGEEAAAFNPFETEGEERVTANTNVINLEVERQKRMEDQKRAA